MAEIINWITSHVGLISSFIASATVIITAVLKTKKAIISAVNNILDNKLKRIIS